MKNPSAPYFSSFKIMLHIYQLFEMLVKEFLLIIDLFLVKRCYYKNNKKQLENSIFARLIITFLLIILPLYFVGIQIFNWSKAIITCEILNSMKSQAIFYFNSWANEI